MGIKVSPESTSPGCSLYKAKRRGNVTGVDTFQKNKIEEHRRGPGARRRAVTGRLKTVAGTKTLNAKAIVIATDRMWPAARMK